LFLFFFSFSASSLSPMTFSNFDYKVVYLLLVHNHAYTLISVSWQMIQDVYSCFVVARLTLDIFSGLVINLIQFPFDRMNVIASDVFS